MNWKSRWPLALGNLVAAKAAPSVRDLNSTNCRKLKARCASLEHEHCCQALSDGIKTTKRGKEGRVKRFCTGL
ncbi:hypothetical protein MHYP_G00056890 [Metynnis hypsauchen]